MAFEAHAIGRWRGGKNAKTRELFGPGVLIMYGPPARPNSILGKTLLNLIVSRIPFLFCISVAFLLFIAAGCSNSPAVQSPPPQNIVISVTPTMAAIATGATIQFTATGDTAGVTWTVSGVALGGAVAAGTVDANGNFAAASGSQSLTAMVTATSKTDPTKSATVTVNVVAPGVFATTNNIQVAQYTVSPAASANVSVQFGLTTTYGLTTWTQPTPASGGVSLYVAGMKQSSPYHMRGVIQFNDGSVFNDADQTFTTQALPAGVSPNVTVTTTAGMTPQPGVELVSLVFIGANTGQSPVAVTDVDGNVLWTYMPTGLPSGDISNPIKLLSNGHFLMNFSGISDGANSVLQEVDLGNNVIWQMTAAQLNTALAAATCAECNVHVVGTHHDFVVLPSGHIVVIASLTETLADGTTPTGDIIIDLGDMENVGGNNPNHTPQPVWAWNEFNHLDTNRRPYMYPDWTHTNAVIYSADDGNLIISIRHQNWLLKLPYQNGAGSGDPVWHLGFQGDFTLLNADGTPDTSATDWFFAQHGPSFTTTNTTGQFGLVLFDNGDDRGVVDVAGGTCGTGQPVACYSTVPLFTIDETAKTATLSFNPTTPDYSFFGGNAEVLKNGNVEYDECGQTTPANNSAVFEVTQAATPQTVWEMKIAGQYAYRAMRIPSLYPGVQW
jgi:arylsulfate sulfotransferase